MVAIVIPVYKEFDRLTKNEFLSLTKALHTFSESDIYIIGPISLNVKSYEDFFNSNNRKLRFKQFNDNFFKSLEGYNRLCISSVFYKVFLKYEFLLIYQTDAFVFRDNLNLWCSKGIDYIGAPWVDGWTEVKQPLSFIGVGNGGFSLRKVASFYRVACNRPFRLLFRLHHIYHTLRTRLGVPSRWVGVPPYQEDQYWGQYVPKLFKWFKVAPPEQALQFSFEVGAAELYRINGNRLPMGCHAWEKYEPEFWKQFIPFKK